jgi:hypothetical protein
MARSLVVKHEEKLGTSGLLNGFLLVLLAWMVGGALLSAVAEDDVAPRVAGAGL